MSFLSKIGGGIAHVAGNVVNTVKKAAVDTGHAVGDAASNPWVKGALAAGLAATGVGAPMGAAIMGGTGLLGGALKRGGGLKPAVTGGVTGALTGGAAGAAGGLLKSGVGAAGALLGHGGSDGLPELPPQMTFDENGNIVSSGGDGILDKVGGFLKGTAGNVLKGAVNGATGGGGSGGMDMGQLLKILGLAGAGVAGVSGYNDAKQATDRQNQALDRNVGIAQATAEQGNALLKGAAPIRAAAEAGMQKRLAAGAPAPTSAAQFADPNNPFRKKYGPAVPPPVGV